MVRRDSISAHQKISSGSLQEGRPNPVEEVEHEPGHSCKKKNGVQGPVPQSKGKQKNVC
jgi:hypothetical protein